MTRRSRKELSEEDRELWRLVTASIDPLADKAPDADGMQLEPDEPSVWAPRSEPPAAPPPARSVAPSVAPTEPMVRRPRSAGLATLDRRRQRQIASGRIDIDARLDLHGMTQTEAHRTLRAFLYACSARGDRLVLVITGKGTSARQDDDFHWDAGDSRDRGVLRRNVPRWLAEPDLAPLVVGYATAGIRHGGDGALYLQIRTRRE